jgi:steroid 5-alpha reductase family enzyme
MAPLVVCLVICGAITAATWHASLATREYSWVDRIWSIAPVVYVWVFALGAGFDARLVLMAGLVTAWGIRLTFNYARKGGYRPGGEDYRWAVLRGRMSPVQFQVFNLLFVSISQNALILLFCLPAYTASEAVVAPLGVWDVVLALAFLGFLVGETIADQQQWTFHRWKAAERAAGRTPAPGFLHTGLFRVSRHPNFFFEQGQWWVFYGFAIAATDVWLHWTIAGAALLTLLFIGSTIFTESISRARYPDYDEYRARTSAIVPWFPRAPRTTTPSHERTA